MNREKQIEEMVRVMNECCNRYDEQRNLLGNKCYECEEWSDDNHCCCSYNRKEATALYNAGYRKQSEWISVDERLPPKYEKVLVFDRDVIDTSWINSQGVWYDHSMYSVTHWMPLPEAPKGGEK